MLDATGLTVTQWLIVIMAAIGFAFDIYELLMLPLILRPALLELLGAAPNTDAFNLWRGLLFFIPALGKTAAELPGEHKNRISHRGIALQKLLGLLREADPA